MILEEIIPPIPPEAIALADIRWIIFLTLVVIGLLVLNHYWKKWTDKK